MHLGAGRATKDDTIDPNAGLVLHHGVGDAVRAGLPLATLYAATAERAEQAGPSVAGAFTISDEASASTPLIYDTLGLSTPRPRRPAPSPCKTSSTASTRPTFDCRLTLPEIILSRRKTYGGYYQPRRHRIVLSLQAYQEHGWPETAEHVPARGRAHRPPEPLPGLLGTRPRPRRDPALRQRPAHAPPDAAQKVPLRLRRLRQPPPAPPPPPQRLLRLLRQALQPPLPPAADCNGVRPCQKSDRPQMHQNLLQSSNADGT